MDETKIEPHDGELESHADKTESENSVHAALGRLTNQRLHSTAINIYLLISALIGLDKSEVLTVSY